MSWERKLQGTPGLISVLHAHSRRLDYHPHVHILMPAAAIDINSRLWRTKGKSKNNKRFIFNHKALAKVFRAKMLAAITSAGFNLPACYPEKWMVNTKSVGTGAKALIYLGRYLYRGVIQEKDIVACKHGQVTYRFQNSKSKKMEYRTVPGCQFLWLVLQHVLPKGLRRARNYGFQHPNSKRLIALIQLLLKLDPNRALTWIRKSPRWYCPTCKSKMKIVATRLLPIFTRSLPT